LAAALVGAPFLRTGAGRRAFGVLAGGRGTRNRVFAAYAGFAVAYAATVLAVGAVVAPTDPFDRTVTLCWPFSPGVAAVTVWLPSMGTEWRDADRRVEDTLAWAAFVAALTATAAVGWLLLDGP
ncbi:hypothetical protein, partial [Candidatus Halobonum tyrrellensis]